MEPEFEVPDVATRAQNFTNLFGISWDELRAQGINPDEYARQHFDEAMKRAVKTGKGLPQSRREDEQRLTWLWRGYIALFVGFGFLLLSLIPPIKAPAEVGAIATFLVWLGIFRLALVHASRKRRAVKKEKALTKPGNQQDERM
jgi:hypothetical protein